MSSYDFEYERSVERKSHSNLFMFLFFSAIMSSALFYAYYNDLLPHYTLVIDNGTYTIVRDDPHYLAQQAAIEAEATRQIYRLNGVEVSKEEYEQAKQRQAAQNSIPDDVKTVPELVRQNPVQAQQNDQELPTGQVRKCLDAQNHPVYQTEPCSSKGLKMAKVLTSQDGAMTQATYNYKQAEENKQANMVYKVDGRIVSKAEFDQVEENNRRIREQNDSRQVAYCSSLEQRREWIRSQQRNNSTQYWRDQYTEATKEWQDKCLGISKNSMS